MVTSLAFNIPPKDTVYKRHADALARHFKTEAAPFSYNATAQLPHPTRAPHRKNTDIPTATFPRRQSNSKKSKRNEISLSSSDQKSHLTMVNAARGHHYTQSNYNQAASVAGFRPKSRLSCFGWRRSRHDEDDSKVVHNRLAASVPPATSTRQEGCQVYASAHPKSSAANGAKDKKVTSGSEQKIDCYAFIIESIDAPQSELQYVHKSSRISSSRTPRQQADTLTALCTQGRQGGFTPSKADIHNTPPKITSILPLTSTPTPPRSGRRGLPLSAIPSPSPKHRVRAGQQLTNIDTVQKHTNPTQSKYSLPWQEQSIHYTCNPETAKHPDEIDSPTLGQELSSQLRISTFAPGEKALGRVASPTIGPLPHLIKADSCMGDDFASPPKSHFSNTTIDTFSRPASTTISSSTGFNPFHFDEEQDELIHPSIWNNWSSTDFFPVTNHIDNAPASLNAEQINLHQGPKGNGCVTYTDEENSQRSCTKSPTRQRSQKAAMTDSYLNGVSPDRASQSWLDFSTDTEVDSISEFPATPEIGSLMSCRLSRPVSSIYSLYLGR